MFDQLFEGYPTEDPNAKEKIFSTFMEALGEDSKKWTRGKIVRVCDGTNEHRWDHREPDVCQHEI